MIDAIMFDGRNFLINQPVENDIATYMTKLETFLHFNKITTQLFPYVIIHASKKTAC